MFLGILKLAVAHSLVPLVSYYLPRHILAASGSGIDVGATMLLCLVQMSIYLVRCNGNSCLANLYLGVFLMPYGTYHVADKIGRSIRMAAVRRCFRSFHS
jgi:hypothetical protein